MWLTRFKTALVLEDMDQIAELIESLPSFQNVEEMEEAFYLLQQSKEVLEHKKLQSAKTMHQLKDSLEFLKSTRHTPTSSLNLKF